MIHHASVLFGNRSTSAAPVQTQAQTRTASNSSGIQRPSPVDTVHFGSTAGQTHLKAPPETTDQDLEKIVQENPNLQRLDLTGTQVTDLRPLANLTNLEALRLTGTKVADLQPLTQLTKLQVLDLGGTLVRDVSPLAQLDLWWLGLHGTPVSDLSSLYNLRNLDIYQPSVCTIRYELTVGQTDLIAPPETTNQDLEKIVRENPDLQRLDLAGTQVSDVSPLAQLTLLKLLNLSHTPVSDVSPLANLTHLAELCLYGTPVDVSPLAPLTDLKISR